MVSWIIGTPCSAGAVQIALAWTQGIKNRAGPYAWAGPCER